MRGLTKINPLVRAIGVFSAVAVVVGGVTFAALNSQITLTNSSVRTASAELQVYNSELPGYSDTAPGFTVTGLVPGEGVTNSFYLKNNGQVGLNVSSSVPNLPPAPEGGEYGFSGFENVLVSITGQACGETVETNLLALNNGDVALPCNPLAEGAAGNGGVPGTEGNYDIKFDINPAAIDGDEAGVGNFDIVLKGEQDTTDTPL